MQASLDRWQQDNPLKASFLKPAPPDDPSLRASMTDSSNHRPDDQSDQGDREPPAEPMES
jgi:hypothetical protein